MRLSYVYQAVVKDMSEYADKSPCCRGPLNNKPYNSLFNSYKYKRWKVE